MRSSAISGASSRTSRTAFRRLQSIAMDKLTQTVRWSMFVQMGVLQKIEEFCRVFVHVIGDSSIQHSFQVFVHCLLLFLEIHSLMNI
jgi:hypothetical protein